MSQHDSPVAGRSRSSALATPSTASPLANSGAPARAPRWFAWLGLAALTGYLAFLGMNMSAVAGGSDSSGYMNSARLFAEGKLRTGLRVPPEFAAIELKPRHFMPAGFDVFPAHPDLAPSYPTGFPLHLALGGRLLGWRAGPFLVQLIAAGVAVWLCYLAARELGLHPALAGAGAAVLAVSPVFIFASIQTLSDTLATTWTVAAIYCALRGRICPGWAAACGASLAIAVLVRPTNLLLAPALVVLLGFDLRRLLWFVVGGIPGALWLGIYNHHVYGGAFKSGYVDIFSYFGPQYFAPTATHFGQWLARFLPPVLLVLPLVALVHGDTRRREWLGLGLLFIAIVGFYLFCSFSHDDWTYLRYILPAVPALILAGLLGVEALARGPGGRWPRAFRSTVALVLTLWAVGSSWHWTRNLHVLYVPLYERAYEQAAQLVRERVPADALMVCGNFGGAIYYYTAMPTLIYDMVESEAFARYAALARNAGRPIYAAIFDIEEEEALRKRCPGTWKKIGSAGNIGIWQLE